MFNPGITCFLADCYCWKLLPWYCFTPLIEINQVVELQKDANLVSRAKSCTKTGYVFAQIKVDFWRSTFLSSNPCIFGISNRWLKIQITENNVYECTKFLRDMNDHFLHSLRTLDFGISCHCLA
jgi:hypothetical protein